MKRHERERPFRSPVAPPPPLAGSWWLNGPCLFTSDPRPAASVLLPPRVGAEGRDRALLLQLLRLCA